MKKECVNIHAWHRQVLLNVLISIEQKGETKAYIALLAFVGIFLLLWFSLTK